MPAQVLHSFLTQKPFLDMKFLESPPRLSALFSSVAVPRVEALNAPVGNAPAWRCAWPTPTELAVLKLLAHAHGGADAPKLADYEAAGISGVDPLSLPLINDALRALGSQGAGFPGLDDMDLPAIAANLQRVAMSATRVLASAQQRQHALAMLTLDEPGSHDYHRLGVRGIQTAAQLRLLNDVISATPVVACTRVHALRQLAASVTRLMGLAEQGLTGNPSDLREDDYLRLQLSDIQPALVGLYTQELLTDPHGDWILRGHLPRSEGRPTLVDTREKLQAIVSRINAWASADSAARGTGVAVSIREVRGPMAMRAPGARVEQWIISGWTNTPMVSDEVRVGVKSADGRMDVDVRVSPVHNAWCVRVVVPAGGHYRVRAAVVAHDGREVRGAHAAEAPLSASHVAHCAQVMRRLTPQAATELSPPEALSDEANAANSPQLGVLKNWDV